MPSALSPFVRVLLLVVTFVLQSGAQALASKQDTSLLPLTDGSQWALSNPYSRLPAYVTVMGSQQFADRRSVRLRIDTPFTSTTLILGVYDGQVTFEGLATGEGRSLFDDPVTLIRDDAKTGDVYETSAAKVTVVDSEEVVFSPAGVFTNCRHLRLELPAGIVQDWYLAPGVGIVRLGNDFTSFFLNLSNIKPYVTAAREARQGRCPSVGIAPNPVATSEFTISDIESRLNEALTSGSRFHHLSATWKDLEPAPGEFRLDYFRQWLEWSERYGFDITLTIRTVDTRVVALPDDLKGKKLSDPEVIRRFAALLDALTPMLTARVRWVDIANEVDTYFLSKPEDLGPFIRFYKAGYQKLKDFRSDLSVGVVFAYNDYRFSDAIYLVLNPLCDHISFTYYPIRTDVRPRDPSLARSDIAEMIAAAGDREVVFTEVGYPSSEQLGRGVDAQGQFYSNVFDALQSYPGRIGGASFFLMSDIPTSVVRDLVGYYNLPQDGAFTQFLSSLGLHDADGNAKPAWDVFSQRAPALNSAQACNTDGTLVAPDVSSDFSRRFSYK